jgi:uncharacterized protein YpmB
MNKKIILIIIAVIILISLLALVTIFKQDYKPFSWDGDKCVTYTKDCTCFGLLVTLESYPPQYRCQGLNFCKDINITECR